MSRHVGPDVVTILSKHPLITIWADLTGLSTTGSWPFPMSPWIGEIGELIHTRNAGMISIIAYPYVAETLMKRLSPADRLELDL